MRNKAKYRCKDCKFFARGLSVIHRDSLDRASTVCLCKPKVIHGIMNVFHYQVPPGRKACGMFERKTGNIQDDLCNFDL